MSGQQHCYPYPRPALTVDAIIVAQTAPPQLLLIQRKHNPFAGSWALPGGFVDSGEGLEAAAARELQEETSVDPSTVLLTQVGAFGEPGRDPRGWTITVAFAALVPSTQLGVKAADDAQAAEWFPADRLPALAFDHKLVVRTALRHLATQPDVAKQPALVGALWAAAERLDGPWQQ
ncbi:nudix hydrolase [Micractinium conductrix]|uniref:Nudix hydrolase n=1 Tax=Micractinium conductrix TaxID=554055 RepID=A0A2P6V4T0_9CHLO|nr:nudix hydrolase [Micractinium conductrix]|eukprot:PSC69087.1 nudix hydrolase [Micractinium conductrix]